MFNNQICREVWNAINLIDAPGEMEEMHDIHTMVVFVYCLYVLYWGCWLDFNANLPKGRQREHKKEYCFSCSSKKDSFDVLRTRDRHAWIMSQTPVLLHHAASQMYYSLV